MDISSLRSTVGDSSLYGVSKALLWPLLAMLVCFFSMPALASSQHLSALNRDAGVTSGQQYAEVRGSDIMPVNLSTVISLRLEKLSLEEALQRIAEKASLDLVYGSENVSIEKKVTLNLEQVTAQEALQEVLRGTKLGLMKLSGGQIVIVRQQAQAAKQRQHSEEPVRLSLRPPTKIKPHALQTGRITGTVIDDATGNPLPGVNVAVEGTQQGAATDAQGEYTITGIEVGTYNVRASFVGYGEEVEEGVEIQEDEVTVVDFVMQQEAIGLDEVVAIGYGEQQRRDVTGSVSSISAADLEQLSITSVDEALQGMAPGVFVKSGTGQPGGGISVTIRGQGSISSGNAPLYVIDGMPVNGGGSVRGSNPLSTINPQDIESIQVLKDASATAIYGSRGSNGVVIVETKSGQSGRTQVNFSSRVGMNYAANTYDLLSAEEFVTYSDEGAANKGIGDRWPEPASSYGRGTDWQDLVFETRPTQNYQLRISGGDPDTRFSVSGSFLDDKGVMESSQFRRYSGRINFFQDVSDDFRVRTDMSVSRGEYNLMEDNGQFPAMTAISFTPVYGPFNDDGTYVDYAQEAPFSMVRRENPLAQVRERNDLTTVNRLIGNAELQYDLLESLEFRTKIGTDIRESKGEEFESARLVMADYSNGSVSNNRSVNVLNENLLEYNSTFGEEHSLNVLGGFTWQQETNENSSLQNSRFVSEATGVDALEQGAQPGGPSINTGASEWTLLSWLGRTNYTLMDRYLFTATARADGSSRFGKGNKWGFFPSGAVAWRLSEERFIQSHLPSVSNMKLRVSFGVSGNQQIGTYSSLSRLSTAPYFYGAGPEVIGMVPRSVANPDLQWETSEQWDVGFDLGLWSQKLRFTADIYRKETTGLILPVTLPANSGFGASIQNTGTVLNQGLELSVNASVFAGDFSWITGANWSANRNEVIDLGSSDEFWGPSIVAGDAVGSIIREGEPIGMFWGVETNGLINDQEEADELGYGEPGGIRFVDQNGDSQITEADRTTIGNPHPEFIYGWMNTFDYGGFRLNAFIQGVYGNDLWLERENDTDMIFDARFNTFQERFDERWTPDNKHDATWPKAGLITQGAANGREGEFIVHDGSYLRLKSLTLSYEIPVSKLDWMQSQGVQGTRIFIKGTNLFTLTDYIGFNPDVDTDAGNINQGFDQDAYPLVQTYSVGIDLTL